MVNPISVLGGNFYQGWLIVFLKFLAILSKRRGLSIAPNTAGESKRRLLTLATGLSKPSVASCLHWCDKGASKALRPPLKDFIRGQKQGKVARSYQTHWRATPYMEIVIAARFSRGLEASQATLVGSDQVTGYGWAGCENQWVANTDCSKDNVSGTVSVQNRIRKVSFIFFF